VFRYEQTDSHVIFKGHWNTASDASAADDDFCYADTAGSSAKVSFVGTRLVWIAKKSPVYGMAKVSVDGGAPATVDLYSPTTLWRQTVWQTGRLSPGTHRVTIQWTGTKDSAASGTSINVDAFDVTGALVSE
jgi:hypothetical protein